MPRRKARDVCIPSHAFAQIVFASAAPLFTLGTALQCVLEENICAAHGFKVCRWDERRTKIV